MWPLLKLQAKTSWKMNVFIFTIVLLIFAVSSASFILLFYAVALSLFHSEYYKENQFYKLLFTMPIKRVDIVKAKFFYDTIIIAILMLLFCIRLVMSAHIYKDLAIMLGLLSACLILSSYYSFMFFKWRERIDSVDLYIGMILAAVIALAHTVFYWIEVPTFDFALLFIVPIITSYICYMFYKKSVHYMTVKTDDQQ